MGEIVWLLVIREKLNIEELYLIRFGKDFKFVWMKWE